MTTNPQEPKAHQPVSSGPQAKSHLAIVALDVLNSTRPLRPHEPCELAPGITISVLQSASEALIEIEESAIGKILIDNKVTSELATVRPGQLIKVTDRNFVLLKAMQAMIIPRNPGYKRPEHVQKLIELVLANQPESRSSNQLKFDVDANLKKINEFGGQVKGYLRKQIQSTQTKSFSASKLRPRTILLAVAAVGALSLAFIDFEKNESKSKRTSDHATAKANHESKSTITSVDSSSMESARLEAKTNQPMTKQEMNDLKRESAIDALKAAMKPQTPKIKKAIVKSKAQLVSSESSENDNVRSVKLSAKDRQLVLEYRMEARFDRAKARAKMKELKESYPVGSAARAEVEQAYGSM